MLLPLLAGLAAVAAVPSATAAHDLRQDIGLLTCELAESREAQSATETAPQRLTQDMLCAFRPGDRGPEETYTGSLQYLVGDQQPNKARVMIWIVKGPSTRTEPAGFLQQVYAADPASPAGQVPALIGESNGSIVLQPMADSQAPSTDDKRPPAAGSLIVLVALRLKATSG